VHRLLSDLVDTMGLSAQFEVGQSFLRGLNGSEFIFKGLRHNAAEIKSLEAADICWVEEGQAVSDDSWALLIPTIRAPGSEIWVTFNPDQESDPAYQRFVVNPPPNAIARRVNYDENPWFPAELEAERAYLERVDPDAYANVWLGACRSRSDAQVLMGKWTAEPFEADPAAWDGPYYGVDWGFAQDPTVMVRCWIHGRDLYIDHEAWGIEIALDDTPALFDRVPGARQAPVIRADAARPETIRHLQAHGYEGMRAAKKWPGSVEDGVEFLRSFERIVIHPRCTHTAEEARLWSFKTDRITGDVLPALKPGMDHGMDAIRYALSPIIRSRRSAMFIDPDPEETRRERLQSALPGLDPAVLHRLTQPLPEGVCGRCQSYQDGRCRARDLLANARDPACAAFDSSGGHP